MNITRQLAVSFCAVSAALVLALPSEAASLAERISADHKILKQDRFYGFERTTFEFKGCEAWIVEPMVPAAKGRPWTWMMQWATAFVPRTPALHLLREGWHHVTIDLFKYRMNDEGVEIAAAFQEYLVGKLGFNARACLIGMSWGGFFSGRYTAAHPSSVAAIYFDCPLLSFRKFHDSDPADSKKTLGEWWASSAPADWSKDPRMPVNMAEKLAGVPVFLLYGGVDRVVPPEENCEAFVPRFKAAGGKIEIHKRDAFAHHPHGLEVDNPAIARFFQREIAKFTL